MDRAQRELWQFSWLAFLPHCTRSAWLWLLPGCLSWLLAPASLRDWGLPTPSPGSAFTLSCHCFPEGRLLSSKGEDLKLETLSQTKKPQISLPMDIGLVPYLTWVKLGQTNSLGYITQQSNLIFHSFCFIQTVARASLAIEKITLNCSKLCRKITVTNTIISHQKTNVLKPAIHAGGAQEFHFLIGCPAIQEHISHSLGHSNEAEEVIWFKEMAFCLLPLLFTH